MAQNNENLSNFIDQGAWSDFEKAVKYVEQLTDMMAKLSTTANETFKGLGGVSSLKDLVDLTNKAGEANKKVADTTSAVTKGIKELNAEQLRSNLSIKERNDLLKLQVQYEAAPANSIAKMRAEIRLLTAEYNKLDLEKQKDLANNKKLELDQKNTLLKSKVDSYTAQKINIGNYPDFTAQLQQMKAEMESLARTGQKDSEEFTTLAGKIRDAEAAEKDFTSSTGLTSAALHTTTSAYSTYATQLTTTINHMDQLSRAGKEDSKEFKDLAQAAAMLRGKMDEIKGAIDNATKQIEEQKKSTDDLKKKLGDWAKGIGAVALAYVSLGQVKEVLKGAIDEISQADENADRLKNTLESYGNVGAFTRLASQADEFADKIKYLDNDDVREVFNKLLTYGKLTEDQMTELLPVIVDFAAKERMSITDATDVIVKALEGNGKALKTYGINIKEAAAEGEALASPAERLSLLMKELKPRVEGAAQAFGQTLPGQIAVSKQWFRDMEEELGRFLEKLSGLQEKQFQNAVAAKQEADQAQRLVNEYEQISKKVNQTTEDKERLNTITTQLVSTFGNSVVSINKETGALELNIAATKDLIKQKLLLANQEASKYAMQYNQADEGKIKSLEEVTKAQLAYDQAVKQTGLTMQDVDKNHRNYGGTATMGTGGGGAPKTDNELLVERLWSNLAIANQQLRKFTEDRDDALERLQKLGFKEEDVKKLFNPDIPIVPKNDLNEGGKAGAPDKDSRIENEKAMSAALYEQWKLQTKMKADQQKEIMDDELESYEKRKEALIKYQDFQSQLARGELLHEYHDKNFEIQNAKQQPKETDSDFAKRKQVLNQELITIEQKFNNQILEDKKALKDAIKKLDEETIQINLDMVKKFDQALEANKATELNNENIRYKKGLIDWDDYNKNKEKIERKYTLASLMMHKAYYEQLIAQTKEGDPDVKKYQEALDQTNTAIKSLPATKKEGSENPALAAVGMDDEDWAKAQKVANGLMELEAEVMKAVDQRYAREIANLERKKQLIDENYNAEISAIQGTFQSQAKKDAAIAQLKAQQLQQDKQINEEIVRMKRKQAQADKAAAIAGAIEKGAVAVVNALDTQPVWLGIAMAAIVGASVAIQVANAANTPLPQYGEGTEDHPGGDAIVGELYKPEYIIRPGAKRAEMVNRPTRLNLPAHTRVIPEEKLLRDSQDLLPQEMMSHVAVQLGVEQVIRQEMSGVRDEISDLKEVVRNKKENHFHWSNGELRKSQKIGNSMIEYLNSNFN